MIQTVLCSSLIGPEDNVWGDTLHDVKSLLLVERPRDGEATPETLTRRLGVRVVHVVMTDEQQEPASYRGKEQFTVLFLFIQFYCLQCFTGGKISSKIIKSSYFFVLLTWILLFLVTSFKKFVLNFVFCHIFFYHLNKVFFCNLHTNCTCIYVNKSMADIQI